MLKATPLELISLLIDLYSSGLVPDTWVVVKHAFYYWVNHLPEYLWLITNLPFG
jgi:hypothetical protein